MERVSHAKKVDQQICVLFSYIEVASSRILVGFWGRQYVLLYPKGKGKYMISLLLTS